MSSALYAALNSASTTERHAIITPVFEAMRHGDAQACLSFHSVCQTVLDQQEVNPTVEHLADPSDYATFSAEESIAIVAMSERLQGFLHAIAWAPQAHSVIEAGTGASGVLAIGAALFHPNAEVEAYELNPFAAHCARKVIELCGLTDRVEVTVADALTHPIPSADMGITETYDQGLFNEPGVEIASRLAAVTRTVVPHAAVVYARDTPLAVPYPWQRIDTLTFRNQRTHVDGVLHSTGLGVRAVHVAVALHDSHGMPILSLGDNSGITAPEYVGKIDARRTGQQFSIQYSPGIPFEEAEHIMARSNPRSR